MQAFFKTTPHLCIDCGFLQMTMTWKTCKEKESLCSHRVEDRIVHLSEMSVTMVYCMATDQLYHHLLNRYCHQCEDFASLAGGNAYNASNILQ